MSFKRYNKAKARGTQCAKEAHLLYCSNSFEVILYKTNNEHSHQFSNSKISQEMKMEIEKFYNLNLKPKAILVKLN